MSRSDSARPALTRPRTRATEVASRALQRLARMTPKQILAAGWLAFMLYAFPGYMSYDSVFQLSEARSGHFSDGHPPAMAELWRIVDAIIAGPVGMLLVQSVSFLVGCYLIVRTRVSPRTAALIAAIVLCFPPVAAVMAVIWKDAQMTAYIVLGVGLVLGASRRARIWGLAAIALGTAMRHNAIAQTLPLIVLLFVWDPRHGFWKRYLIACVAWFAVTLSANLVSRALTDEHRHLWSSSIAMCDITSTLRYVEPTIPDDRLREMLAGTEIIPTADLHAFTRRGDADSDFVRVIWDNAYGFFAIPTDKSRRDAMVSAWKRVVFAYPAEYLTYRWELFKRLVGLNGGPQRSPVYNWFTDIQDPFGSADRIEHQAAAGKIQNLLRRAIHWVGETPIFSIAVYLFLAILLLPFTYRDREAFALLVSGLASEALLFLISPTIDWRYSYWLVVSTTLAAILIVARRIRPTPASADAPTQGEHLER